MPALHTDVIGLDRIRFDTNGLASLAETQRLDAPVTTCGSWSLADLTWHLLEVQHFWTFIIGARPAGPEQYTQPPRPADTELAAGLRAVNEELLALLAAADPSDQAWSWSEDHTVGFTVRRQTHEALVHHIDGIMACGQDLPQVPSRLGADGVDEMLGLLLSVEPDRDGLELDDAVIEVASADTDDRWTLGFGWIHGTADDGSATVASALVPRPGMTPAVTATGPALALNLWLWGRTDDAAIEIDGDDRLIERLFALIAEISG